MHRTLRVADQSSLPPGHKGESLSLQMNPRILLVEDEGPTHDALRQALAGRGVVEVVSAASDPTHVHLMTPVDLVILGPRVARPSAACARLRQCPNPPEVVFVSARPTLIDVTEAMRAGAHNLVSLAQSELTAVTSAADSALEARSLAHRLDALSSHVALPEFAPALLGESDELQHVRERARRAAGSQATVLITGESGTGKEVLARVLHEHGTKPTGPFVAVACSAIAPNLLEAEFFGYAKGAFTDANHARQGLLVRASGGTLLLDEMSDLPLELQAKLLRALQERRVRPLGSPREVPFDTRIVVATTRDLHSEVARGRFRADLYFRLKVIEIRMPPLRDRGPDVLLLAHHFLRQTWTNGRHLLGVTDAAARALCSYHWPGNVRELAHCMSAAAAVARYDRVTEADLPSHVRKGQTLDTVTQPRSLREVEQRHILKVMTHVQGNKSQACRILGLDRKTLARKLEDYAEPLDSDALSPIPHVPPSNARLELPAD